MSARKLAGVLWIMGGLYSAAMVFGVLDEPAILALAVAGAIVGLTTGMLVITRPGPSVVRWSNVAGIAWLIGFGALTVAEVTMSMGYVLPVLVLTTFGVVAALVASRRPAAVAVP
jgi:hypothetical protein